MTSLFTTATTRSRRTAALDADGKLRINNIKVVNVSRSIITSFPIFAIDYIAF
jgi:hypothetical protein